MNDENCMKFMSYIWDNVLLFDGTLIMERLCLTKIIWFH